MELIALIVGIVVVFAINTAGDAKHRENAEWVRAADDPIANSYHATNGCMGVLMWVGFAALIFALLSLLGAGGIAVGGGQ